MTRFSRPGGGIGGSNSVVESQPSKLLVAGSIPVSRSRLRSMALQTSFVSAGKSLLGRTRSGRQVAVRGALRHKFSRAEAAEQRRRADVAQLAEHVLGK